MICNAYEYIPETDIMMYINYTSIKKIFKNKFKKRERNFAKWFTIRRFTFLCNHGL